jgi:uncharacterized coiled-coil DUF342 family protein
MNRTPREVGIETLTTPKGDVPTIKGLEKVINSIISEHSKLGENINDLSQKLVEVSASINQQSSMIKELSSNLTELIVYLGKLESKIDQKQLRDTNSQLVGKLDLITIKNDLSNLLIKIESTLEQKNR